MTIHIYELLESLAEQLKKLRVEWINKHVQEAF